MTTIQDRIIKDFRKTFCENLEGTGLQRQPAFLREFWYNPQEVEQFIIQSIKLVQEETRKETIDKYFLYAEKRLSITNKDKQK